MRISVYRIWYSHCWHTLHLTRLFFVYTICTFIKTQDCGLARLWKKKITSTHWQIYEYFFYLAYNDANWFGARRTMVPRRRVKDEWCLKLIPLVEMVLCSMRERHIVNCFVYILKLTSCQLFCCVASVFLLQSVCLQVDLHQALLGPNNMPMFWLYDGWMISFSVWCRSAINMARCLKLVINCVLRTGPVRT